MNLRCSKTSQLLCKAIVKSLQRFTEHDRTVHCTTHRLKRIRHENLRKLTLRDEHLLRFL